MLRIKISTKGRYALRMLPVWQGLYRVIDEYLDGITLQDILDRQKERYCNDYVI